MSVISVDDFLASYPEFADVPVSAIERQLKAACLMLSPCAWGKWLPLATELWVAHYLALSFDISGKQTELGMRSAYGVGVGNSMSASTSSLSISSTTPAFLTGDDPILADMGRTTYGLEWLSLLYTVIPPGMIVHSPDTSLVAGRR